MTNPLEEEEVSISNPWGLIHAPGGDHPWGVTYGEAAFPALFCTQGDAERFIASFAPREANSIDWEVLRSQPDLFSFVVRLLEHSRIAPWEPHCPKHCEQKTLDPLCVSCAERALVASLLAPHQEAVAKELARRFQCAVRSSTALALHEKAAEDGEAGHSAAHVNGMRAAAELISPIDTETQIQAAASVIKLEILNGQ